jgi:hypothetical protein
MKCCEYGPRPLSVCPCKKMLCDAGNEVLMEVDDNGMLIVFDPQGNLYQQVRPHPIHL